MIEPRPAEFDELADHTVLAQHLRHGEHEIGRGHALLEPAGEPDSDHLGQQHRHRLSEHRGLGLDAADAPAQHAQAVDHGGVRIGADHRVRIGHFHGGRAAVDLHLLLAGKDGARQIFEIDLVADAGARRHHAEILERALRPFQESVAFLILLVFLFHVLLERRRRAEEVDDHRMIDDEIDRNQRIDLVGIAAEMAHGVTHGGQIDDGGHAGEILHQHPRRTERNLVLGAAFFQPSRNRLDVVLGDRATILVAQQILQQHLHAERQPGNTSEPPLLGGRKTVIDVGPAADLQGLAGLKAVERAHDSGSIRSAPRQGRRGRGELARERALTGRGAMGRFIELLSSRRSTFLT